ncbi:uncharacterized protein Z520_07136 [Fonsecaea multimorphosa CBS 102226]|uniref:Uncharacterized protein n=1 Tax=Fonsecaea multimorphosa CBS 102226 TaxID=1442371 RepID=A0A0D2JU52_9EURO|nr:uncharacterized protein Z520_07136 [Fonsecaea multimorphosa CBS 102226]KIX97022.1 hypothetical protein Z520_07136 [Fonsecaea multimorphosa CBS 102226]OAL22801.1 hypothetical protein AYO22_06709 [Fonsecaea multimorphosa]
MTTATTHPDFSSTTDGLDVAAAFPSAIKDRTILITGVNRKGIGYSTAESLASQSPRLLILAGRSVAKLQECIDDLKAAYPNVEYRPLQVDLSSQKSVRAAAKEVLGWEDVPAIDIVINNAGIMNIQNRTITEDGVEITMATNHVGHFLLTNLIMPKILAAAEAAGNKKGAVRIVNLASMGIYVGGVRFSDMGYEKPVTALPDDEKPNIAMMQAYDLPVSEETAYFPTIAYGASKTAAVLFSVGLNDKLYEKHGILSFAVNPGEIETELGRNTEPVMLETMLTAAKKRGMVWKTQQQGCSTTLVAALDDKLTLPPAEGPGVFMGDCQPKPAPPYATSKDKATKLWEWSEQVTGDKFAW